MRILITGGFGFIGGRLAVHLSKCGHQIILASRVKRDVPDWLVFAETFHIDWCDESKLREVCSRVDIVIHAAGMNSNDCQADPEVAFEFNGVATARLVRAAVSAEIDTFIYLSTAHVYASPLQGEITEATKLNNPHPYATSHLAGEDAVLKTSERGKTQRVVLRLANIYGAPTHAMANCWMLLVNDLCKQAVTTREILVQSSGLQQRNFLTMSDACVVIEKLLATGSGLNVPAILNVGSRNSETINDMATLIQKRCKEVLGINPIIKHSSDNPKNVASTLNYGTLYSSLFIESILNNKNSEIDSLLEFCRDSFAVKSD